MPTREVFPKAPFKSHMPFFDGHTLLFCLAREPIQQRFRRGGSIWSRMEKNAALRRHFARLEPFKTHIFREWKLAYCSWSDRRPTRLDTGLPAGSVECSPAFFQENGVYHVSFIARATTENPAIYHLYRMSGPSLDRLGPAERVSEVPTRLGFISPRHVCLGHGLRFTLTSRNNSNTLELDCPLSKVLQLSFSADQPDNLIVTGADAQQEDTTLLYRIASDETFEVRAPGPLYKASLFKDQAVFAKRFSGEFEDRRLWHGRYRLVPSKLRIRRAEK